MDTLKKQIRDIIATAVCKHCSAFQTCKGTARCGAFVPSAELYEEIKRTAGKAVVGA